MPNRYTCPSSVVQLQSVLHATLDPSLIIQGSSPHPFQYFLVADKHRSALHAGPNASWPNPSEQSYHPLGLVYEPQASHD